MKKIILLLLLTFTSLFIVSCGKSETPVSGDDYRIGYNKGYNEAKEKFYQEGYDAGETEGYNKGYQEGSKSGTSDSSNYDAGLAAGYKIGYEKGVSDSAYDNIFSIHTKGQAEYANVSSNNLTVDGHTMDGHAENSRPVPVKLTVPTISYFNSCSSYKFYLSEDKNFTNKKEYTSTSKTVEIYNLKIHTPYYWYCTGTSGSTTYVCDFESFIIDDQCIRNLFIDGVTNARDLGGWAIVGTNKYTVQGLVYRMGRLHTNTAKNIKQAGIDALKELGIKTEIDLRLESDNNTKESAVPGVTFYQFPVDYNVSYFSNINKDSFTGAFKVFADKNNYPIIFHCSIGTDRTGFVAFVINALCGVAENNLYKDYLFSNFADISNTRDSSAITSYINTFKKDYMTGNDTLAIGARNYLKSIGLTDQEVTNIYNYMTGVVNPLV